MGNTQIEELAFDESLSTVVLLETIDPEALELLRGKVNILEAYGSVSFDDLVTGRVVHAVITRGKGQVNRDLLAKLPELKVVARCGVGLDNVDVTACTEKGIRVVNAPGSNSATIAEHTITLMLMLIRNMFESAWQVKEGNWNWRNSYQGDELSGKTLGVLGMGNIGRRVARLGEAFGMRVVYWDKFPSDAPYTALELDELLATADVVTLHLPLFPDTEGIISEQKLSLMQPHTILVNTARGSLVDQQALFRALSENRIAGFGADVLDVEPPSEGEPLLTLPNTIITAHVGSLTATTYRFMCTSTVRNVLAILTGGQPEPQSIYNRKQLES